MPRMRDPQRQELFEQLLTQDVYRAAWNYSWRLCNRREDAEDLLQEALVHALRKLDQLKDMAMFKSWLLSIVRTRFLNGLRAQKARPQTVEEMPHIGGEDGPGTGGLSPELLTAMLIMESAFGLAGLVAAPICYAWLKDELVSRRLI